MTYIVNAKKYQLDSDSRVIVQRSNDNKIIKRIRVPENQRILLRDSEIEKNIDNYRFKFQSYSGEKWVDASKYFLLIQKQNLGDFWIDKTQIDSNEILNQINYFTQTKTPSNYVLLRQTYKKVCEDLWLNHNSRHINLKKYLDFIEKKEIQFDNLWENLNLYLKYMYRLKMKLINLKLNRFSFVELVPKLTKETKLREFINNEIDTLKSIDLQFSYMLIGQYYSLINNRDLATKYLKKASSYGNNFEKDFLVGQGSATYNNPNLNDVVLNNPLTFIPESINYNTKTTILVSVDIRFLRNYAAPILFNIIALQKYHFHFHVIGDEHESKQAITETQELFKNLLEYTQKQSTILKPTFSFEELPGCAKSLKTYSACARFVNASRFMDKYNTNLLILDADMFINDDLKTYLNTMSKFDVGIATSVGVTPIMPWRRLMAGNIYLNNSSCSAKAFIDFARDYILSNLHQENSWTLDQNALTYAYEKTLQKFPDIKLENIYKHKRPVSHPAIRKFIERV